MPYTDLNRFHDALKGRPMDRVPVLAAIGLWAATNYPGASFEDVASDSALIAEAQLWAKRVTGIDAVCPSADPLFIAEAFGCKVRFLETGPLVDPLPILTDIRGDVGKIHFPDPREAGRCPVVLEAARMLSEKVQGEVPVMGIFEGAFTNACRIIGTEQILRMTYRDGKLLEALLDGVNKFLIEFGQALLENGINTFFIPEPTASSTMISPGMFNKFVLPRLKELINELDVPIILHICGDTKPILAYMTESGSDVISLDQCMDLAAARAILSETAIAGNVDPVESLLMGHTDTVKKDTLHCLQTAGIDRFILMPGCGVPPSTPVENLNAMVRATAEDGIGR